MSEESQEKTDDATDDSAPEIKPGLSRGMWIVLIAVGAVVVVGVGFAIWLLTAQSGGSSDGSSSPSGSASIAPGPDPTATPTTGSEVLPPSGEEQNVLPPRTPATPLVSAPLPESASGEADLVPGFPAELMGPAPGAEVVQNSIATEGTTMQVSLVARTDETPESVGDYYGQLWASKGLTPQADTTDGGLSYLGAFESLSLAFTPASGTGTVYMIYGVFRTE